LHKLFEMKTKRIYREKLSFDKAELSGSKEFLTMDNAGLSTPAHSDSWEDYKKTFSTSRDWLNFGSMWGSMNDPKFYAGLKTSDIVPKKEDFIEAPFRLISATVVGAHSWKATDFSNLEVLKGSMQMLEGKPLYKDHETDVDNWVGLVSAVKWGEGFVDPTGVKVPSGIDGIVAIDAKTNPKVARGVLMGSVFSNSVTVEFDWTPSHTFESPNQFYEMLGKYAPDGKMVRRVVTAIHNYHESSLVWLGADPFAKMKTDTGSLKNIDVASIEYAKAVGDSAISYEEYSDTAEEVLSYKDTKKFRVSFGFDSSLKPLLSTQPKNSQQKLDKNMKELLLLLSAKLNIAAGEELTEAVALEKLKGALIVDQGSYDAQKTKAESFKAAAETFLGLDAEGKQVEVPADFLTTHTFVKSDELSTLKAAKQEVEQLKTEKQALEADAKLGKDYIEAQRAEAVRLYKASAGDQADEAVIGLFNKADTKELAGLLKQHGQSLIVKYGATCTKCGDNEHVSFRSTFSEGDAGSSSSKDEAVVTSDDLYSMYSKRPLFNTVEKEVGEE